MRYGIMVDDCMLDENFEHESAAREFAAQQINDEVSEILILDFKHGTYCATEFYAA